MKKLKPKYKSIFVATGIVIYMLFALSFSKHKAYEQRCTKVNVEILDSTENMFVSAKDIDKIIAQNELNVIGYPVKEINSLVIEEEIEKHPSIETVHVYGNVKGSINVRVEQRNPILRILSNEGNNYYIDDKGKLMPLSDNYTSRVLVVTGDIDRNYKDFKNQDYSSVKSDSLLHQIFVLSSLIKADKYWAAMCDQITVNKAQELVLIPKIGAKRILFGNGQDYPKYLKTLTTFYKEVLPVVGWGKYKSIDLQYNQQIVCK